MSRASSPAVSGPGAASAIPPALREASPADIPALIEAERACFGKDAWTPGMVREEFERAGGVQVVVAERATIIGFAFGWLVVGELHVLHIATLPDLRRQGVGRRLLAALLATPGIDSAWLEVRADNPAAIALYLAQDFVEVGRRKRYYADGIDAVVMRRDGPAPPR